MDTIEGFGKFLEGNELGYIMKLGFKQRSKDHYVRDTTSKYKKEYWKEKSGLEHLKIYTGVFDIGEICEKLESKGWILKETLGKDELVEINLLYEYDFCLGFWKI